MQYSRYSAVRSAVQFSEFVTVERPLERPLASIVEVANPSVLLLCSALLCNHTVASLWDVQCVQCGVYSVVYSLQAGLYSVCCAVCNV